MMRKLLIAAAALAGLSTASAHAASFNCAKAKTADEKAICKTQSLSDADVKMATLFDVDTHLVAMGERGSIQDDQSAWLKSRHACGGNIACLGKSYGDRIKVLQAQFDQIASRGPF